MLSCLSTISVKEIYTKDNFNSILFPVSSQAVTPPLILPDRPTVVHLTDSHRIASLILQAAAPPPHRSTSLFQIHEGYYYDYDYCNLFFNSHWVSTNNTNTFVHAVLSLHNLSQGNLHTTAVKHCNVKSNKLPPTFVEIISSLMLSFFLLLSRQRLYFEQRKRQGKKTGYEGHADETSMAGRHQKECQSLDILSLLNLSTFSAVGKCYPSTWASFYLLLLSDLFDEGSSNDLIFNRSSIISNMILGDQTAYLPKSKLAPEKLEKVLKEASRLYAASWVRDIGPDLRPNDYNKDDGTEGKSNGDKSRSTETEPSTLEDIDLAMVFWHFPALGGLDYRVVIGGVSLFGGVVPIVEKLHISPTSSVYSIECVFRLLRILLIDSSMKMSFNRYIRDGDLIIVYERHDTMKAVKVNRGGFIYLLAPAPELWTLVLSHRTQMLYIADISFVIMYLEVIPGCLVLESGTGSGSLTTSFARAVAPTGHVYTFDFHEQRAASARVRDFPISFLGWLTLRISGPTATLASRSFSLKHSNKCNVRVELLDLTLQINGGLLQVKRGGQCKFSNRRGLAIC
ncbi:hypothetical protein J1N35_042496 [Gossypium stocksii]|uniref:tRNA (adenine(58)-N(1))-methyltransferase n=1 Tax=Gossypium stocksii TaxID=47602 RepID=A0A9D3ZKD3_9ROSI|nr:hypothetical protein J1N35_042496 [Gossypium stocksii]